jgi:hypothetical protein
VPVLLDDILVTVNQFDLTRPSCISLINATSEAYTFAMSVLFDTKRMLIHKFVTSYHTSFCVCLQ